MGTRHRSPSLQQRRKDPVAHLAATSTDGSTGHSLALSSLRLHADSRCLMVENLRYRLQRRPRHVCERTLRPFDYDWNSQRRRRVRVATRCLSWEWLTRITSGATTMVRQWQHDHHFRSAAGVQKSAGAGTLNPAGATAMTTVSVPLSSIDRPRIPTSPPKSRCQTSCEITTTGGAPAW